MSELELLVSSSGFKLGVLCGFAVIGGILFIDFFMETVIFFIRFLERRFKLRKNKQISESCHCRYCLHSYVNRDDLLICSLTGRVSYNCPDCKEYKDNRI